MNSFSKVATCRLLAIWAMTFLVSPLQAGIQGKSYNIHGTKTTIPGDTDEYGSIVTFHADGRLTDITGLLGNVTPLMDAGVVSISLGTVHNQPTSTLIFVQVNHSIYETYYATFSNEFAFGSGQGSEVVKN